MTPLIDAFATLIVDRELPISPSHAHGALVGMLACSNGQIPGDWLSFAVGEDGLVDELDADEQETLRAVVLEVWEGVRDEALGFTPYLPADDIELRLAALSDWCAGFLSGLGIQTLPDGWPREDDVAEALRDVNEFARSQIEISGHEEDDEDDFTALYEHVRISTMLIVADLDRSHDVDAPAPTQH